MYKTYKAYMGRSDIRDPAEDLNLIIAGINERGEEIIQATNVIEGYYVLIITKTPDDNLLAQLTGAR